MLKPIGPDQLKNAQNPIEIEKSEVMWYYRIIDGNNDIIGKMAGLKDKK